MYSFFLKDKLAGDIVKQDRINAMIEVLTRSGPRRDVLFGEESLSDEDIVLQVAEYAIEPDRLRLLVSLSRLLRLMDGFLSGKESGESFVVKFAERWLSLQNWEADPNLESEFDELNNYYSEIQLFSPFPEARYEEPLLFGLDGLKELTQSAYERLFQQWHTSLTSSSASSN